MDREPPVIGLFGALSLVISAAFLAAGLVEPTWAPALLRLFLVFLAAAFVLSRAYVASLPARMTQDSYSPFDGSHRRMTPPSFPREVRTFARELTAANRPRRARRTLLPGPVSRRVIDEADRRLALHHGLKLERPEDHPAIRGRVSAPTWALIAPAGASGAPQSPQEGPHVDRLPTILADLERL